MTTTTTRLGLSKPEQSDPTSALRESIGDNADILDTAALDDQGAFSSRPVSTPETPGKSGRWYWSTDTLTLYRDHGTGWTEVAAPQAGCFSAYRNASYNVPASPTVTALVFDTEEWDASGWYDISNGRFTPELPGVYRLTAAVTMQGAASMRLDIFKNGALLKKLQAGISGSSFLPMASSALVSANGTTDYFDIRPERFSGVTAILDGPSNTYFQGERVG
jgi:hypothetical protein